MRGYYRTFKQFGVLIVCVISLGIAPSFSQTIYTPNGSVVSDSGTPAEDFGAAEKAYYNDYVESTYPNATRLSDATTTYNCHGYAWHMTEGGFTAWIGLTTGTAEDVYWTDGSYVTAGYWAASKVSYSENHSAVTTSTDHVYKSKWGSLPLMKHDKDYVPSQYGSASSYRKLAPPPPSPPTNLTISGSLNEPPVLSWTASSGSTSYRIYRCEGGYSCTPSTLIGSTSSTTYTDWDRKIQNECSWGPGDEVTRYHVNAVNSGGTSSPSDAETTCTEMSKGSGAVSDLTPSAFGVHKNYPDPFNPQTNLRFDLPSGMHVSIDIFDLTGRYVTNLLNTDVPAGSHVVAWDASNHPSGAYLYRVKAGSNIATGVMMLVK